MSPTPQIIDPLANRRSIRAFASSQITDDEIGLLFEAARWAPSSRNLQPWRFVWARPEDGSAYESLFATLSPNNQVWAKTAPLLVLGICATDGPNGPNRYAMYDTGQAVAHLITQATALGIYAHQMGGFDRDAAREAAGVPSGYDPAVMIALGREGDPAALPEELRSRAAAPRTRTDAGALFFHGRFGG